MARSVPHAILAMMHAKNVQPGAVDGRSPVHFARGGQVGHSLPGAARGHFGLKRFADGGIVPGASPEGEHARPSSVLGDELGPEFGLGDESDFEPEHYAEGGGVEEGHLAASELIQAVQSGDPAHVWAALQMAFATLESEPHEEAGASEGDGEGPPEPSKEGE